MDSVHFFFFGHKGTGWIVSPSSKMTHSSGMGLITLIGEWEKDLEGRASSLMAVVPQLSSLLRSSDHPGIGGMGQFQCAGMVFVASAFEFWPYFFFFFPKSLPVMQPAFRCGQLWTHVIGICSLKSLWESFTNFTKLVGTFPWSFIY